MHEWGLSEYREEIVRLWRKINLLSKDRGVNRFVGLGKVLEDINDNYFRVEGLAGYQEWVANAKEDVYKRQSLPFFQKNKLKTANLKI